MGPTAHLTPRALTRLVRPLGLRQLTRPCAFGSRHPISYPVLSFWLPTPDRLPGSELDSRPPLLTRLWAFGSRHPVSYPELPTCYRRPVHLPGWGANHVVLTRKLFPCAYPAPSSGLQMQDPQLTTSQTNAWTVHVSLPGLPIQHLTARPQGPLS